MGQGEFTAEEARILRCYFTNLDQPVFALVNLPEVVKGALFARYSRSPLSLRRLFLEEFADDLDSGRLDTGQPLVGDATVGLHRAEALYDRVFFEYGDDSVAQLGGVHLACEQASNLLTKVLEWGRLMAYLEQSTRYVMYGRRPDGRYPYFRDAEVLASPLGARYSNDLDGMFDAYGTLVERMQTFLSAEVSKLPGDSDAAYRRAVRARALDAARGALPAAASSNVGIYGSGQAYEALLMRMRAHPLPEARQYSTMMMRELRKVIPSFLKRVDLPDRGGLFTRYMADNRIAMDGLARTLFESPAPYSRPSGAESDVHCGPGDAADEYPADGCAVELVDFDPAGEEKMIAAMLYPHTWLPERTVLERVEGMSQDQRLSVARAYCGTRENRRHRPGRALERTSYRFDVLSDYGCFRDLQRHRMLTIEWQPLSTGHGYVMPDEVEAAGASCDFEQAMALSARLHEDLLAEWPNQAQYAVALAYRVRYVMQFNAREAMHMLELRTGRQGHPAYRRVCQEMHRLIAERAGHRTVAEMMTFVDHSADPALGRLEAESRNG